MAMTDNDALALPFSEIRAADLPLVGGKGANLGEMAAAGFPVPPGFCLTTTAFRRFIAASPDAASVYDLLDTVTAGDIEGVRRVGQQVRQTLLSVPIPLAAAEAARHAWREIGPGAAYAVRSSATAEDLPDASFAGQQDTYLNVTGEAALLDAIRRCWVSLFTDRAILYRIQNNFSRSDVQLSVVVQQMVFAEKSGILFTADPVTGHRHTLAIDASFGLGEALVGGLVTPDTYRVDKRSRTILDRQISAKQIAILPLPDGGTRQASLPPEQRTRPTLSDAEILALADLACRVEAHYQQPQDIEWAMAGGQTYLLQSRPITTLYPSDGLHSPDDTLHIFFSMGHQQSMTRAMSPISLSSFPILLPIGRAPGAFESPYLRASGGRLFIDVTDLLRHPLLRRIVFALTAQFDALAPQALKMVMQRPEFQHPHGLHFSRGILKGLLKILWRLAAALWWSDLTGFTATTNALMDDFVVDVHHRLQTPPPGKAQLQAALDTLPDLFPFFLNWVPEAVAGIAATRILPRLARRYLSLEETETLTLGIPGNVVNEMNLSIGDLADLARQSPDLRACFEHLDDNGRAWLSQAAQLDGAQPFLQAWTDFIARYGARGPSEIDIMMPRWYEDPLPVLHVIAGHLQQDESSRARFAAQARAREAAFVHLQKVAGRGPLGWLRLRLFRRLYYVMTQVGGMREHHKFLAVRVLWEVKQALKSATELLVAQGKLTQADDIWFLRWRDLMAIWDDEASDWHSLITQRRVDLGRFQKLIPPMIITSEGETPVVHYHVADAPPGALIGNPVSPGVVEGVAHVVRDPQKETLQPGEILVAEFTDPGWTPLFINAGGLVLEIGGVLTHGAVVAREYGIPAVVGVRGATRKIRTGQRLRVDGNRGIVEILNEESP